MTPPVQTGDPVRDAENMRSFANQYAQMYGSDNARQMGYTGPDLPGPVQRLQSGTPGSMSLGVQTMDPGQNLPLPPARGPSSPYDFMGPSILGPNGMSSGGAPKMPFARPKRGANVPDWMLDNPDFDPRAAAQMVVIPHFNPATGEIFESGPDQYMVDPSLKGDFVNPNRPRSLMPQPSGPMEDGPLASGIFGASPTPSPDIGLPTLPPVSSTPAPSASQPTGIFGAPPLSREGFMQTQRTEMQGSDERHREQHSQMGNGGGYSPMGGGLMDLASAQSNYGSSPFMAPASGYQTGSPFGSMPSQFGGGLPRGYYT